MNYKELLDRYKKGLASEEEKRLVEQELEKQEAFEEYALGDFDKDFNNIIKEPHLEVHDEETRKLKKSVNKRLGKVVLTSVLAIILLYFGVFYGVSGIINGIHYNPNSVSMSEKQEYKKTNFFYDMQAYLSLKKPGHSLGSWVTPVAKGFGKYEIMYSMKDLFTKDEQVHFMNLSKGRLSYGIDGIFGPKNHWLFEGFQKIQFEPLEDENTDPGWYRVMESNNEETIHYLNELNPLSYISMSIVFQEDLTMEEFYKMSNEEYPLINFKWIGIRTAKSEYSSIAKNLIGFNPNSNDEGSHNQRPNLEKYPLFYLHDMREDESLAKLSQKDYPKAMSEAYRIHFNSRLQYLRDREEFIKLFDFKTEFYDDALEYIDENGIKTYGVLVYGTASELLKYVDAINYDSIYINQVLPAKPSIYHD